MRRIFVGDIHGCRAQLERLLAAVGFGAGDVLHPVGDLVNKGPDSLGVLRLARELGALSVMGNHDHEWLQDGKIADRGLAAWLGAQPYYRLFDDVLQIHAGLHPAWTVDDLAKLDAAGREYAINVRYCTADGARPPLDEPPPGPPFRPWDAFYRGARTVVFGHWARRGFERTKRVIALDSGCVYGGPLTAWIAEEDRIVQVR